MHVPCCAVQGLLHAVLLCLRYVDITVTVGAWFVPSLRGVRTRNRFKNTKKRGGKLSRGQSGKTSSPWAIKS